MLSWDAVSLHLRSLGYAPVTFFEIDCPWCGHCFRIGISQELEPGARQPCPGCSRIQGATLLANGYTRHELPLVEKLPSRRLSAVSRAKLLESVGIRPEAPPKRKKITHPGPRLPVLAGASV